MALFEVAFTHKSGTFPVIGDVLTYTYSIGNTSTGTVADVLMDGVDDGILVIDTAGTSPMPDTDISRLGWIANVVTIATAEAQTIPIYMMANTTTISPLDISLSTVGGSDDIEFIQVVARKDMYASDMPIKIWEGEWSGGGSTIAWHGSTWVVPKP